MMRPNQYLFLNFVSGKGSLVHPSQSSWASQRFLHFFSKLLASRLNEKKKGGSGRIPCDLLPLPNLSRKIEGDFARWVG